MFKGIIFDLDGTTVQTIDDLTNTVNYIRNEYGFSSYDSNKVMSLVGHGLKDLTTKILPIEEKQEEAYKKLIDYYNAHYLDKAYAYDGMNQLLATLQNKGIKIGINSNKKHDLTVDLAKKLYPDINFTLIIGQREGHNTKPDPEGALEIIKEMKLDKDEVCYCGDSPTDIKTGKNAGLYTIGVSWGFRDPSKAKEAGANLIVKTPEDILKAVTE